MRVCRTYAWVVLWAALLAHLGGAQAQETELESLQVLDDNIDFYEPDKPTAVSPSLIEKTKSGDVGKVVKNVSGVYVRDEDGFGLRPNIGLRGTNPDRSKKVVLMEDGILIAPAPYSAPAAYYSPNMARTNNVDIYKGLKSIEFGPNSIGGAINYRTKPVAAAPKNQLEAELGLFNSQKLITSLSGPTSWGGYLVNATLVETEGFKQLDNGGETGFQQLDLFSKFRFAASAKHQWELRLGIGNETSNETYLGLNEFDFSQNPNRRYVPSSLDKMQWEHRKAQIAHSWQASVRSLVQTDVYHHEFERTWYRFDSFGNGAPSLADILKAEDNKSFQFLQILRNESDSASMGRAGELYYLNNQRKFLSQGVQSRWIYNVEGSDWNNSSSVQLRFHRDHLINTPSSDSYELSGGNLMPGSLRDRQNEDRFYQANATTLGVKNTFSYDTWSIGTYARAESVEFFAEDRIRDLQTSRNDQVFVPGVGVAKTFGSHWQARTSFNKAVTVSGRSVGGEEKSEESDNYELEISYKRARFQSQVTYFLNDYKNLTGTCNASNGCAAENFGAQFNGGEAIVDGIEAQVGVGLRYEKTWFPIYLSYTYLDARFDNSFYSDSGSDWGVGFIKTGDPLPYIPQQQYVMNVGMEYRKWTQNLALTYSSQVFDQSVSEGRQSIPAYGVVDWYGSYQWASGRSLYIKVENLLSQQYAIAARPFGLRPGKPFFVAIGAKYAL